MWKVELKVGADHDGWAKEEFVGDKHVLLTNSHALHLAIHMLSND
jgi:hypothetical protein